MFKRTIWPILCGILSTLIWVIAFVIASQFMGSIMSSFGMLGVLILGGVMFLPTKIVFAFINACTKYDTPPTMNCARKARKAMYFTSILLLCLLFYLLTFFMGNSTSSDLMFIGIPIGIVILVLIKNIITDNDKPKQDTPANNSFEEKLSQYTGRPVITNEKEEKPDIYTTVEEGSFEDKFAKARASSNIDQRK